MLQHFKFQFSESPIWSRGGTPCVRTFSFTLQNALVAHFSTPITKADFGKKETFPPKCSPTQIASILPPSQLKFVNTIKINHPLYRITVIEKKGLPFSSCWLILWPWKKKFIIKVCCNLLFLPSDFNRLSRLLDQLFFHMPKAEFAIKESKLNTLTDSTDWHFVSSTLNEYADKWSHNSRLEKCDPV